MSSSNKVFVKKGINSSALKTKEELVNFFNSSSLFQSNIPRNPDSKTLVTLPTQFLSPVNPIPSSSSLEPRLENPKEFKTLDPKFQNVIVNTTISRLLSPLQTNLGLTVCIQDSLSSPQIIPSHPMGKGDSPGVSRSNFKPFMCSSRASTILFKPFCSNKKQRRNGDPLMSRNQDSHFLFRVIREVQPSFGVIS